ncbi:MAG: hypothetical protein HDR51_04135 [Treponema sp.]|nr:hypothetical protein [Treponema sp.]MBD5413163.1 hypothetical protein [Treponema sp.]
MTWEMMLKERHDDGRNEGRTEGIAEGKIETARNMLKNGLSADLITKCTGISAQQISELL